MNRRLLLAMAVVVATVVFAPRSPGIGGTGSVTAHRAPAATTDAPARSMAPAEPDCDPEAALFASMFRRLSIMALANAGIDQGTFDAQRATQRARFEDFLAGFAVELDAEQLAGLLAGFPAASGPPFGTGRSC